MDEISVKAWEGRTTRSHGTIDAGQAQRIHATLDRPGPAPVAGESLPPLWHWCAFLPDAPTQDLGEDGHPRLGSTLPEFDLRRRMWAGGSVDFMAPITIGEPLTRESTVLRIEEKRSGDRPMMIVTLQHDVRALRGPAIRERQTLVYLDIPDRFEPPRKRAMPREPLLRREVPVSEALLFRFSAVTFNAHRIHYDRAYTREVEHYPDLVIHGPLQAMLLMGLATEMRGAPIAFEYRTVHPMFLGKGLDLMAEDDGEGGLMLCTGQDGHQGTVASALWEGTQ